MNSWSFSVGAPGILVQTANRHMLHGHTVALCTISVSLNTQKITSNCPTPNWLLRSLSFKIWPHFYMNSFSTIMWTLWQNKRDEIWQFTFFFTSTMNNIIMTETLWRLHLHLYVFLLHLKRLWSNFGIFFFTFFSSKIYPHCKNSFCKTVLSSSSLSSVSSFSSVIYHDMFR